MDCCTAIRYIAVTAHNPQPTTHTSAKRMSPLYNYTNTYVLNSEKEHLLHTNPTPTFVLPPLLSRKANGTEERRKKQ